ncbi:MAG: regulator of sigma D [Cocleimonas sp.]|jgi:regulator of sigma D
MHSQELEIKLYSGKQNLRQDLVGSDGEPSDYDVSLINVLEENHQVMINTYNKVLQTAKDENFINLQLLLVDLLTAFTKHVHVEDQLINGYLKILAKRKSRVEEKIITKYSLEIKDISITIFSFFSQNPFIPVNKTNSEMFIIELEVIGQILQDRIDREERILYPIFKNSRKTRHISS